MIQRLSSCQVISPVLSTEESNIRTLDVMNRTRLSSPHISTSEPLTKGRGAQKHCVSKKQRNVVWFYSYRYASVPSYCWLTS